LFFGFGFCLNFGDVFLGFIALFGGRLIAGGSVLQFFIRKTTINPHDFKHTTQLVSTGIFQFSRNPMYLSLLLILIAWTLWLGNSLAWLGVIVFILVMNRFQIAREEAYLESKFGDEYRRYKQKVRRWL